MKQSGTTRLFIFVCIAVLLAAYGVGIGVKKIRFAGVEEQAPAAADTEKPVDEPESAEDEIVTDTEAGSEPSEEWAEQPYEEPEEEFTAREERPGGGSAQMVVIGPRGMVERFPNMTGDERARKELQAAREQLDQENFGFVQEIWPNLSEELRKEIMDIQERWPTMSEEERDYYRAQSLEVFWDRRGSRR